MTSRDRRDELKRYANSLNVQPEKVFPLIQLIFVDQGANREAFEGLDCRIEFIYITTHHCSLSKARNIGLQYATGDYICFPDDDCWYDNDTLEKVISHLEVNREDDGVVIIAKDEDDVKISDFPDTKRQLTYKDHCCALSISLFLKFDKDIKFDENIGVGSPYNLSSGEETDYLLTYMERHPGFQITFIPSIIIRHPLAKYEGFDTPTDKIYGYARGNGYIIRKHPYGFLYKLLCLIKPFVWIVIRSIINRKAVKGTVAYARGRVEGFFFRIKD